MPIVWRDEMSVGNDHIDRDHRYLLCLFNSIELALSNEKRDELLPVFFEQLFEYTKIHFDREEKLQLKLEYSGYYEHKMQHQEIVESLKEINDELHAKVPKYREGLIALIREWVVDHLIVTDKAMKAHLSKYPKDFQ